MARMPLILIYISLLLAALPARSETTLAGVTLDDTFTLSDRALVLDGAGVRSKFPVDVYVGALYLPQHSRTAHEALATAGPMSMHMFMLYRQAPATKIARGWDDGFHANLDTATFTALQQRLQDFNALFPDLRAGDIVHMDYVPGRGTQLSVNGRELGRIQGEDFFAALLQVRVGDYPADEGLKRGLLGPY